MKLSTFFRLRIRLLLLVLLAVIPALALILYNAREERRFRTYEIQQSAQRLVRLAASREAQFVEGARQLLIALTQVPEVRGQRPEVCSAFMADLLEKYAIYTDFGVIKPNGEVSCSGLSSQDPVNLAHASYFRRALASRQFSVGDYNIDPQSGRAALSFGYPILSDTGKVEAVIFASLDLAWVNKSVAEIQLPEGAALTLVDSKATVLARYPEGHKWVGKHVPDAPLFQALQIGDESIAELHGLDGVLRLYAFKALGGKGEAGPGYMIVGIPKVLAFAEVWRNLTRNLALLGVVGLLALAAAWFIGNTFIISYVREQGRAREARLQLAAIVESSEDAIIGKTLDGNITSWNKGAERIYGYSADEIIGSNISILVPPERSEETAHILASIKQGNGIDRYETERIKKDGGRIDVSVTISPIYDAEGQVVGASTIARDITERKRVEESLRLHLQQLEVLYMLSQEVGGRLKTEDLEQVALQRILEASGFDLASIHLFDAATGRVVYVARRGFAATEASEERFLRVGEGFEGRVASTKEAVFLEDVSTEPALKELVRKERAKVAVCLPLAAGELVIGTLTLIGRESRRLGLAEQRFLEALGLELGLSLHNTHLYEEMVRMNLALQSEITERKQAEKALADFTAMVAHDLRSPLSNIISVAELLEGEMLGPLHEEQKKWLSRIRANSIGLVHVVSDFLDLSKIEAGHLNLVKEEIDLDPLIRRSLEDCSALALKKNISLTSRVEPNLFRIPADPRRVEQVLGNLLSNAIKFTGDGGTIEIGATCAKGNGVRVYVKDSGVGIPAQEMDALFQKYQQTTSGKTSRQKGTGLGLVICRMVVEAHGGKIWADSKEGEGTTFSFTLPLSD